MDLKEIDRDYAKWVGLIQDTAIPLIFMMNPQILLQKAISCSAVT
jgi:hypothetical protein